jgi:hypothetical protein
MALYQELGEVVKNATSIDASSRKEMIFLLNRIKESSRI